MQIDSQAFSVGIHAGSKFVHSRIFCCDFFRNMPSKNHLLSLFMYKDQPVARIPNPAALNDLKRLIITASSWKGSLLQSQKQSTYYTRVDLCSSAENDVSAKE